MRADGFNNGLQLHSTVIQIGDTMRVGVLKEVEGENRVSIVPGSLKKLKKMGFEVVIETGAGIILSSDYGGSRLQFLFYNSSRRRRAYGECQRSYLGSLDLSASGGFSTKIKSQK